MEKTMEDITAELSRLSRKDRLEIARFLLSLDDGIDPEVASSWEDEITERVRAVEDGRAVGMEPKHKPQTIWNELGYERFTASALVSPSLQFPINRRNMAVLWGYFSI